MSQKKLPLINSVHGSETRNIINELIKLFNGMGYTYDEALRKAHDVLSEAKKTNDMNKSVQNQINTLIAESGTSDAEILQARVDAEGNEYSVLKDRLDASDLDLAQNKEEIGNDVRFKNYNEDPIITFITDDGRIEDYTVMFPIFKTAGVPFTTAVITSFVDSDPTYINMQQMIEMREEGIEICSHTHTHKNLITVDEQTLDDELRLSQDWLRRYGFSYKSFAIPYGNHNEQVRKKIAEYYDGARKSGAGTRGYNTNPVSMFQLHSDFLEENSTLEEYKTKIDRAVANNGWIIISTHSREVSQWSIEGLLTDIVNYAKTKAEVVTMAEGIRRRKNVVNAGVNYINDHNNYHDEHFYLSASGKASSNRLPSVILEPYSVDGNTPIDYFEEGKESICLLAGNAQGVPNNTSGYLHTYKYMGARNTEIAHFYQVFKQYNSDNIYTRRVRPDGTWGQWTRVFTELDNLMFLKNGVNNETPMSAFDVGVTVSVLPSGTGVPGNRPGLLTTYKPRGSDGDTFSYQTFVPTKQTSVSPELYARNLENGVWGDWKKIGVTSMSTYRRQSLPTQGLSVGDSIFDTNLKRPVWLKSVDPIEWVFADGTTVPLA